MEIFPLSQQVISAEDLDALGKLFVEAKNKLLGIKLPEVPGKITTQTTTSAGKPKSPVVSSGNTTALGLGIGSLKT
jgi:hypothetical protein